MSGSDAGLLDRGITGCGNKPPRVPRPPDRREDDDDRDDHGFPVATLVDVIVTHLRPPHWLPFQPKIDRWAMAEPRRRLGARHLTDAQMLAALAAGPHPSEATAARIAGLRRKLESP